MKKYLILLITIILLLVVPFTAFAGGAASSSATPLSFSTKTLYGKDLDSSIFNKYDLIFLNYWAEWCGPCVGEMPDIQKIHRNFKNVLVIGVYVSDDNDAAIAAAEDCGVTYPLISIGDNYQLYDYLTIEGNSFSIPQTCFFDNKGNQLCDAYIGSRDYDSWVSLINEALSGLVPAPEPDTAIVKGLKYDLDNTARTATVTGAEKKSVTKVSIPTAISFNGKTYKVTAIAPNAFKKYTKLVSLTIGKNIKTIGKNAFSGCSNLSKIIIKTINLTTKTVGSNAFKSINSKAVVKCPSGKLKAYKKLLLKKGMPETATIK